MLRRLDTCLLVTTLCTACWVISGMRIDAVEVPRSLTDTDKMAKCVPFKSNDKVRFYRKIRNCFTIFCDCAITYCKLYCFTLC